MTGAGVVPDAVVGLGVCGVAGEDALVDLVLDLDDLDDFEDFEDIVDAVFDAMVLLDIVVDLAVMDIVEDMVLMVEDLALIVVDIVDIVDIVLLRIRSCLMAWRARPRTCPLAATVPRLLSSNHATIAFAT